METSTVGRNENSRRLKFPQLKLRSAEAGTTLHKNPTTSTTSTSSYILQYVFHIPKKVEETFHFLHGSGFTSIDRLFTSMEVSLLPCIIHFHGSRDQGDW